MLKINKILSKKIKFSLSLRGAFPHVIARERSDRSNLSGFSLIELMVAVAILALAIIGIFHAYSVGFMGMADARDRTVASNYMREIMEDIKNTDFEKIEEKVGTDTLIISGKTFTKVVTVEPSTNLKKVSTIIYWDNYTKSVQSNMLIHFMQTTAGDPSRIMLFANPYKITPSTETTTSTSIITAMVKDEKGNNVDNWSGEITFLITTGAGSLDNPATIETSNGRASINYTAPESEGDVTIKASAIGLSSDSVNITITTGAVKIALSVPDNDNILSPGDSIIITAKLVDTDNVIPENITNLDVTFSVFGPGNLTSPTTRTTVDGAVTIELSTSSTNPGTITVIASTADLDPGSINIITGGNIDITSSSNSIPVGESTEITITIKDLNSIPINYSGDIQLSSSTEEGISGSFSENPITFIGSISSTFSYSVDSLSPTGTLTITASDLKGILNSDSISFDITLALIPHHIKVTADPQNIKADGVSTSEITATVKTEGNRTVESYSNAIIFNISNTNIGSLDPLTVTAEKGVAHTVLTSKEIVGQASITAEDMVDSTINGTAIVGFYLHADNIVLTAVPSSILKGGGENGTTTITATIKDGDVPVDNFSGTITFSIISGYPSGINFIETNKGSLIVTVEDKSTASVDLESKNWTGTAIIKVIASDGIFINLSKTIDIQVLNNIELNLVENTISYDSDNIVFFDIEVLGADINLIEMQVLWVTDESLNKIEIKSPNTADPKIIFNNTGTPALSGEIIDVDDIILSTGISNVKIYFNQVISEKTFNVIFNPNSGNYSVSITEPTI